MTNYDTDFEYPGNPGRLALWPKIVTLKNAACSLRRIPERRTADIKCF